MTRYQDYAESLAPVWLRGEEATAEVRARAVPLDELLLRLRTVMLARLVADAPEEALALIGQERGIRRFDGEPASVYRARVQAAWAYWQAAGTVPGMQYILRLAGWHSYITEHYADDRPRWGEFSIHVMPIKPPVRDAWWGTDDRYGEPDAHWGYRLDALPLSSLVELINEIKPAHARLRRLTFSVEGTVWGGDGVWGDTETRSVGHGWGYPYGMPSVTQVKSGEASLKWGDGSVQTIYDLDDPTGGTL